MPRARSGCASSECSDHPHHDERVLGRVRLPRTETQPADVDRGIDDEGQDLRADQLPHPARVAVDLGGVGRGFPEDGRRPRERDVDVRFSAETELRLRGERPEAQAPTKAQGTLL